MNKITKQVILVIVWIVWTLMCIYGTYNNTVKNAELVSHENGEYVIQFNNTGNCYDYEEDR